MTVPIRDILKAKQKFGHVLEQHRFSHEPRVAAER
jgi:hypothetical protein